jgi:3-deoxy-D-manno-octulosonate 8-phosphate phosphatase (KDO 8-P phosphatase)
MCPGDPAGSEAAAKVAAKAAALQLMAFDIDGTLTDGKIYIGPDGEAMKAFCVRDGLGLVLLREAGIVVAIITARRSPIVDRRAAELGITEVVQGSHDKRAAFEDLCRRRRIAPAEAGFMGDDWADMPAMRSAGFVAAPADAALPVREMAHWVSKRPAGDGAARELAEFILSCRGEYEAALSRRSGQSRPSTEEKPTAESGLP